MSEYLAKVFKQIDEFLKGLSPLKKVAVAFTLVAIVAGMSSLFFWAGETTYVPLMTNLNPEDSTNVIRVLKDKRIPFRVDQGGKVVSIPSENLYEYRLELASMGYPQSSVVGYEIFDKSSLGTTSFVQKVNQKRALEGELMRTINTIRGVRRSRVHLAVPTKSTFVEDQKKSTASVVVDLDPGAVLTDKHVYGIGNLVARAVEGMEIDEVVIGDSSGKTISKNSHDPLSAATANQLDFQTRLENDLEKRVENMLSRVVGEGKVVAKVTAELDFAQVAETQTLVDADGSAIVSVEKRNDSMTGTRPGPAGLAGAASNTPGGQGLGNPEIRNETVKNNETVNYDVPKTIRRTTKPVGSIKKMAVAVVIDGKMVKTAGADGKMLSKIEPWPADKLKEFESIVAGAVALDRKRGDYIEIKNLEFVHEDFEEATKVIAEKEQKDYRKNLIIYLIVGVTIGLFFWLVVRPFIKWITENTIDSVDTFLPQTIEELERMQSSGTLPGLEEAIPVMPEKMDPEKTEGEMIREKVITLVDSNPHKAALVLRDWVHADLTKKIEKEEAAAGKKKNASAASA